MTFEDFHDLQGRMFNEVLDITEKKGMEYSGKEDTLKSFKEMAIDCETTPEKVGWILTKKHLNAINSYIKHGREFSEESIRGRFLDAINYLTLIYGLIYEFQQYDKGPTRESVKGNSKDASFYPR